MTNKKLIIVIISTVFTIVTITTGMIIAVKYVPKSAETEKKEEKKSEEKQNKDKQSNHKKNNKIQNQQPKPNIQYKTKTTNQVENHENTINTSSIFEKNKDLDPSNINHKTFLNFINIHSVKYYLNVGWMKICQLWNYLTTCQEFIDQYSFSMTIITWVAEIIIIFSVLKPPKFRTLFLFFINGILMTYNLANYCKGVSTDTKILNFVKLESLAFWIMVVTWIFLLMEIKNQ